jgi:hypothetical protein
MNHTIIISYKGESLTSDEMAKLIQTVGVLRSHQAGTEVRLTIMSEKEIGALFSKIIGDAKKSGRKSSTIIENTEPVHRSIEYLVGMFADRNGHFKEPSVFKLQLANELPNAFFRHNTPSDVAVKNALYILSTQPVTIDKYCTEHGFTEEHLGEVRGLHMAFSQMQL